VRDDRNQRITMHSIKTGEKVTGLSVKGKQREAGKLRQKTASYQIKTKLFLECPLPFSVHC